MRFLDPSAGNPLKDMEECDDFKVAVLEQKTQEAKEQVCETGKTEAEFRNYVDGERQKRVEQFYTMQHAKQTVAFVKEQQAKYNQLGRVNFL